MLAIIICSSICVPLFCGMLYYRRNWLKAVDHHSTAIKMWQLMMLGIMKEQLAVKFINTPISNHIIRTNKGKIEILIGDNTMLVPVDMELFNSDVDLALEEAYSRYEFNLKKA